MGSDVNIAQCFNLATGKYVLILGDDDLLVDHALATVLAKLAEKNYGIVCMRAYGFNHDFRREYPGNFGDALEFTDSAAFLTKINSIMTFISSCIINREILSDVDAMAFCGGNLVQVHLVVQAAIRSKQNFFFNSYLIACQRNNSGGYDFSTVFVRNLGAVLDNYQSAGLNRATIMAIENQLLLTYYPFYILRQRLTNSGNLAQCQADFIHRFQGRALFSYWISPIITLPRPCAIMWGIMATLIGRTLNGDLQRGIRFGWSRLTRT